MEKKPGVAKNLDRGLILVHTGEGKGKSTAAFGVVLRAVGQGLRPIILQFIKGTWRTGEQKAFAALGVEMHQLGLGFVRAGAAGGPGGGGSGGGGSGGLAGEQPQARSRGRSEAEHLAQMQAAFAFAREKAATGQYDLMLLDEINVAMKLGGLDPAEVLHWLLEEKPRQMHVILTGRGAPESIVAAADLVTEMRLVKHHYQAGIGAVRGIEF